jgi:hypothetical protein
MPLKRIRNVRKHGAIGRILWTKSRENAGLRAFVPTSTMTHVFRRLFAALLLTFGTAHATPLSPDPTGFWYNLNESGWGVNIAQQGEVLFVTLLVYDEQKRAQWFVASNVRDTGNGNGTFSGALYRTTGPSFGSTFDPAQVQNQAVGTLSLFYTARDLGQAELQVSYTVNGVSVTKRVMRLTWDSDATRLPGAYFAGTSLKLEPLPQPTACAMIPAYFPPGSPVHINLSAPDTISIILSENIDAVTIIGGQYTQSGQFGVITGGIFRGPIVNAFKVADAQVTDLVVSPDGFTGHIRVIADNCHYEGSIGAIRQQ